MTVASTSISAFHDIEREGKTATQRAEIALCLRDAGRPMTRREISVKTGIEPGAVGGRVNSLVKCGYLSEVETVTCPITGRTVKAVTLTENVKEQ